MGFADHWFIRVPSLGIELHMGESKLGETPPLGTTKKYTVAEKGYVCEICMTKLIDRSKTGWKSWEFPFSNCESLIYKISFQTVFMSFAFILGGVYACSWNSKHLILALLVVIAYFIVTKKDKNLKHFGCPHLQRIQQIIEHEIYSR